MSEDQLRQYRARLKEATAVIERLRGKLTAEQARNEARDEPLAIVGAACRFPGGGDGLDAFWERLADGVDAVREIPAERWPQDTIPGGKPEVRWAALLDAVDRFDAEFFGVSPREAERLDPQQRLLLEIAWEALEDAGARIDALAGAQVGVFAGLNSLDYQHHLMRRGLADVDAYSATGTLLSTASGRISYSFGFQGPCVSLDTACSSSLVAVALACQSLRAGECEVALAGGVTLLLSPFMMALAAGTQALSPDGRCKVLDARANGFVRGEGCGLVVLKRLSDARRDGDLVRAVIRGWAINQDGRSTGLTAPNVRSQEELLRVALARAGVAPHEVGYVEMHGTGTPLGDPIETDALRAVLGAPRADGSSCVLGAVKSNLGHLEAAAGIAGLIKATLALERETVPKNLHFRRLNPRISLTGTPFVVPREPVPWPRGERRRIAGVSSFGISGTNVHVVLEEAPAELASRPGSARMASGTGSARTGEAGEVALGTASKQADRTGSGTGSAQTGEAGELALRTASKQADRTGSGAGPAQADELVSGTGSAQAGLISGTAPPRAYELASGTGSNRVGELVSGTGAARAGELDELASRTGSTQADGMVRGTASAQADGSTAELVVLSARSPAGLDAQAERLAAHLAGAPAVGVGDVAFSLATTRTAMEHRLTVVAGSRAGLVDALTAAGRGETPPGATRGVAGRSKLALLFTGQGAQIPGMGRALCAAWPAFRERFDACVALLDRELPRPLTAVMWAEPGSAAAALLDETLFTQPALFAFEVALAALWQSWGIVPDLVAGHSIGEIAAACAVGVLSLADAARLVAARARLMQALPAGGAMASIEADEDEVAAAVTSHAASVSIAALNGPRQVIVAGSEAAVRTICAGFAARGVRTRPLRVSHAFHSPLMEPMLAAFREATATLEFQPPRRPLVSCSTGALAGPELGTPEYWVRHVREPVRFAAGVRALHAAGARSFVEVGPKPTLLGLVPGCLPADAAVTLIPSVRSADDEAAGVLAALGSVWAGGGAVRWSEVFAGARRVRLPTYAWQRTRHWLDAPDAAGRAAGEPTGHPLLGVRVAAAGVPALFETVLGLTTHPWLGDHRVVGRAVVPAAAVAELVRAALSRAVGGASRVTGLVLTAPLVLPESGALRVQVAVTSEAEAVAVTVYSQPLAGPASAGWTRHASATGTAGSEPAERDLAELRARCSEAVDVAALHGRFAALGIAYGPAFRGLRSLRRGAGEALAELASDEIRMAEGLSPALLDAALQAVLATLPEAPGEALRMPFAIGGFAVHGQGAAWAHVRLREEAGEVADVTLLDAAGTVVAEVEELRLQVVDRAAVGRQRSAGAAIWRLAWQAAPEAVAERAAPGRWVVVGGSPLAAALAEGLHDCVRTDVAGLPAALAELEAAQVLAVWDEAGDGAEAALRTATAGLAIVQATLGRAGRLWWVTRGAVAVADDEAVAVAGAPLWGLGRTLMQEHPELRCTLIDVADGEVDVARLLRELASSDGEDQVALRSGGRHVARLVRLETASELAGAATSGSDGRVVAQRERGGASGSEGHFVAPSERGGGAAGSEGRFVAPSERGGASGSEGHFVAPSEPGASGSEGHFIAPSERGASGSEGHFVAPSERGGAGSDGRFVAPSERGASGSEGHFVAPSERGGASGSEGHFVAPSERGGAGSDGRFVAPIDGTVLVTGGLGALGLHVARWLIERGTPHVLLVGRRGPATPGAAEAVAELARDGARVTVAAVDVADRAALAEVLAALPAGLPLRGVVHAAGALEDGLVTAQTAEGLARVFAPKVAGAWNLHALTEGSGLALFVLFSSLAGTLGAAGQANYAAANAFLDALAAHRRSRGLPAQSLAWGPWAESGMAAELGAGQRDRLARQGFASLAPAQGLGLLASALARPEALLGLAEIDPQAAARATGTVPPVWRALVTGEAVGKSRPSRAAAEELPTAQGWQERLSGLSTARRLERVRSAIQAEVGRVLSSAGAVAIDRPLQELGLDSLMAVELRNALAQRFGVRLPATLVFDAPTVARLAERVLAAMKLADAPAAESARKPAEATEPAAQVGAAGEVPIAIVGMGCRLPGGVDDPEAFWRLLAEGRDAIAEVPRERWDAAALYDPDPSAVGKSTCRSGGFLRDIDRFEPGFFGISPREAARMDPQQRLLLETSWEALERAGIAPERLGGSDTGVFVGLMYQEYGARTTDLAELDGYVSTGGAASVASGRLSYVLGLKGPSMTVDTACSSSLVTVHLACQALRRGECSLALAGGAAVMLTPTVFVEFSRLRGLAPDGRCKSFAAGADGVGWSEGCGMLVLKRLPDALRDGDPVLGVIRGSAVNQDGRSNGLTAPNGPSQEAVIRAALAAAGVAPAELDYVECHGTGTSLGDPIEAQALGAVMLGARPTDRPLVIGSVKSNLGHTQAAAGATGIMKVLLALQHESIPRSLHFDSPSPHVPWAELPLTVARAPIAWPKGHVPRRAGVSSFGVSGTNAHVVIEEAPRLADRWVPPARSELVALSARDAAALAEAALRLHAHVEARPELTLADVALSLATGRAAMEQRLALVVGSRAELLAALAAAAGGTTPEGSARGRTAGRPKLVFVFPGQGGQWSGMGRQLLSEEPVFRARLEECDRAIAAEVGWSVLAELQAPPETARLDRIEVVQPVLFAVEVGLAALWRSWGIEPDAVIGHSMGEVAAAYVAGALTLADAARVICRRSRLLQSISGAGEMAVVELPLAAAEAALQGFEDRLSVAASNGPRTTVIAGEAAALAEVLARLTAAQVFCRRVKVDVASHSPQVEPLRGPLRAALEGLSPRTAEVPIRSTVTGAILAGPELGAEYWIANLREPVRFAAAVAALVAEGHAVFVEMSPHPVLTPAVEEIRAAAGAHGVAVGSQRREQDERRALLESLAALWVHGCAPAWERVLPTGARRVPLPTYAWQRGRYWVEASASKPTHRSGHPLLGASQSLSAPAGARLWESELASERPGWLADHRVNRTVVLPGAGSAEMMLAAGTEALGGPVVLTEVAFVAALTLESAATVQVFAAEEEPGTLRVQLASRRSEAPQGAWTVHARAMVRRAEVAEAATIDRAALLAAFRGGDEGQSSEAVYASQAARGLEYGPAFRGIAALWRGDGQALARVRLADGLADAGRCQIHPALLDACFQALAGVFAADEATWLPVAIEALRVHRPGTSGELWCHARLRPQAGADRRTADLSVCDAEGRTVVEIAGLAVQQVALRRRDPSDEWFLEQAWEAVAAGPAKPGRGRFLLLGAGGGLGAALRGLLEAAGHAVVHAVAGAPGAVPAGCWAFDDGHPAGLRALLADVFQGTGPTAVVHLRSLEGDDEVAEAGTDPTAVMHLRSLEDDGEVAETGTGPTAVVHLRSLEGDDEVAEALARGCDSALHTVQALVGVESRDAARLWLVTRGAQAVVGAPADVGQAPLLGLARVVAMEHPELRCARVDLDPARPGDEAALLVKELLADAAEDEVAWRGATRQVLRLVRRAPEAGRSPSTWAPRADGSYVITGGLGGLGLATAAWLVERGARHLVLIGRAGVTSAEQREAVAALELRGAQVTVARADIAVREQVARVLAEVTAPLAGVVHAAGVLDDGLLLQQDRRRLRAVMAPKIDGALHLDALTRGLPLDLFVLFGSAAGLLGAPGQGNYAAANVFLAALAHRRRADGLAGLCVDWGAFAEVGLAAASADRGERLAARGLRSLSPAEGLAALGRLLDAGVTQAAVVPFDLRQWAEFFPAAATSAMLSRLLTGPASARSGDGEALRARLMGAGAQARVVLLLERLREEAARVLRLPVDELAVETPLTALGMDSLMGLELRNRIEAALGLRIPATLLWIYPTVTALAEHLAGLLAGPEPTTKVEERATTATPVEEPAAAPAEAEDDLMALLDASLVRARARE
uniref:Polyketide synthase n=1 Tax=Nannocystis sp. MB1016 TaxID=1696011 RepID=A0A0M4KKD6_9BACT|nr:polyketide synthase [Nannocystis sp. MB1016]